MMNDGKTKRPARRPDAARAERRAAGAERCALGALLLLLLAACGDEPTAQPPVDACGGRCLYDLGEVCDEFTGICYFPDQDGGADTDGGPDLPDGDIGPDTDAGPCESDEECLGAQYCDDDGACVAGCRIGDADNCDDCTLYPTTCNDELSCHPDDRECVPGCIIDADCDPARYCNTANGLCQRGCRLSPDNCDAITGGADFTCDSQSHHCLGAACTNDDQCGDGAFCDVNICVWGCRTSPDTCGSGQVCDPNRRFCVARPCACDTGETNQTCDNRCDDPGGGTSGFYCNRDAEECRSGCRIRDDGTDTCGVNTICDDVTHQCVPGCRSDDDCPFRTYCDDTECVGGCKPGECEAGFFCSLETRVCTSQSCSDDAGCPDTAYCTGTICLDGCRTDPDNCPQPTVCETPGHQCGVPSCEEDGDCPLREFCNVLGECIPGCAGMDARCPSGEPCSEVTGACGCFGDGDCPAGTHCAAPVCEIDCTPENFSTPSREDSCPAPLACDPASGRCVGDCPDDAEVAVRNDTPDTATCMLFTALDAADLNQTRLCRGGEDLPPETYCDGVEGSWCKDAVACADNDDDWYTMVLNAGDTISFYAHFDDPDDPNVIFVLELVDADDPSKRLRGASSTATGVGAVDFAITESNQYFLHAFAISDSRVPYTLEVQVDRVFFCPLDLQEPNDNPRADGPRLQNIETAQMLPRLSVCEGDRDFFGIELFTSQQIDAIVDPDDGALQFHLGTPNEGATDLDTATNVPAGQLLLPAAAYADPDDPTDPNDLQIASTVPFSDLFYFRIRAPDGQAETAYDLSVTALQGDALCPDDAFEDNDTIDVPAAASYNVDTLAEINATMTFERARLCPAQDGGPADVDYFEVQIRDDDAFDGAFLTASVTPDVAGLVALSILDSNEATVPTSGDPTSSITTNDGLSKGQTYYVRVVSNGAIAWSGVAYDLAVRYESEPCTPDAFEVNDTPDLARSLHSGLLLGEGNECGAALGFAGACDTDVVGSPPLCLCHQQPVLFSCAGNDDWYSMTMLVGDSFDVRIQPTDGSSTANMLARIWPPSCDEPGELGPCSEVVVPLANTGSWLQGSIAEVPFNPDTPGSPISDYLLEVINIGEPVQYQILVQVAGENSRTCPADPWDAALADAPGINEESCVVSGCTLSLSGDNNQRHGNICIWDQRDWFRFTVNGGEDRQIQVQFFPDEGEMEAVLYRESGENLDFVDDLELRTPAMLNPEGLETVAFNMTAGTYQLEILMKGFGGPFIAGSTPNDYLVIIDDEICQDGLWSVGEECDGSSGSNATAMCGTGGSCAVDCSCE